MTFPTWHARSGCAIGARSLPAGAAVRSDLPRLLGGDCCGGLLLLAHRRGLGLAAAGADRHIAQDAAGGPVPLARLAEVARLLDVVVVVVAELQVRGNELEELLRTLTEGRQFFCCQLHIGRRMSGATSSVTWCAQHI